MYTLAELSDDERGWGLLGETFEALERVRRYGGEGWFMASWRIVVGLFQTRDWERHPSPRWR